MPKEIEIRFTRTGKAIQGNTIDYGEWDVAQGTEKTIFLHNPNPHVKADISKIVNKDSRVKLTKESNEISPAGTSSDTVSLKFSIPPQHFESLDEEVSFFRDVLDSLSGKIKFSRA